ncbi:hypothetical protein RTBOTA2_001539 [Rhodotorula toruloides]|nr:hypothetical protein RTBOTA2_001539 [Rhodotorula toruloides]
MLTLRALAVAAVSATLALAQLPGSDESGMLADFPSQCVSRCTPFETSTQTCTSGLGEGDAAETQAFACICTEAIASQLEDCGNCIATNSAVDLSSSESFATVQQLAVSFARGCNMSLSIQGTSPQVSSVLANAGQGAPTATWSVVQTDVPSFVAAETSTATPKAVGGAASPASLVNAASSSSASSASSAAATQAAHDNAAGSSVKMASLWLAPSEAARTPVMSTPDRIAQTGKLADRIAKLGLGTPPTSSSPGSPGNDGRSVQTGARVRVSDKISRFQQNAEEKPLLPEGGSFGFAPAKPRQSAGGSRFADEDKPRVASLGGGRAAVPLNVVKPRSSSAGGSPSTRSEAGSSNGGSRPASRAMSREGSSAGQGEETARAATPQGEPTPVASPSGSTVSFVEAGRNDLLEAVPSGARTPGAMSVSSMRVETGSIASEGGRSVTELDVAALDAENSPLSSPIIAAVAIPAPSNGSLTPLDASTPSATLPPKGPVEMLRSTSRAGSVSSNTSSLMVQAASTDDEGEGSAVSVDGSSGTPTREVVGLGFDGANDSAQDMTREEYEASEAERAARVKEELEQYERDARDPPAPGPHQDEPVSSGGDDGEPKEPPILVDDVVERPETPRAKGSASPIPGVKCSDCGAEVELVDLADHTCAPASHSAASQPTSTPPAQTEEPPLSPAPAVDAAPCPKPDVPEEPLDEPLVDLSSVSRRSSQRSKKQSVGTVDKLDAFVPQTEDLVPEDVLDMYGGDDDEVEATGERAPPAVPEDMPSDDLDDLVPSAPSVPSTASSNMTRSASSPANPPSTLRARQADSKNRSQSVYDPPLPGRYYTSEDEDDGEPGSVTIVSSSSARS